MFLYVICCLILICSASKKNRQKELSRIKKYELLYFNLDHFASNQQIEFDLFDQHYKVQLVANENAIPSHINPTAGHPSSDKSSKWFTSRTQSCHYFGSILEPQTSSSSDVSNVALSLCPNRGIRGSIIINDERIFIKPAAFYLDEDNRSNVYQFTDQHLIYKSSDFRTDDLPLPRGIKLTDNMHSVRDTPSRSQSPSSRKLLASKTLELYLLIDPSEVDEFKDDHRDNWYQELLAHAMDYINSAAIEFLGPFSRRIGDVALRLIRFEVVESWDGDYRSLRPDDYRDSKMDGNEYLGQFKQWIQDHDRNNYDAHQLWTMYDMEDSAGWGYVGCICNGRCTSNVDLTDGDSWSIRTVAHELGHNWGAHHDSDTDDCEDGNDGIMGFGDDRKDHGWSRCSIEAFEEYYDDNDRLTCLNDGARAFSSNKGGSTGGGGGGGDYTPDPPTSIGSGNCMILSGFNSQINGEWAQQGSYNNKPYYERGNLKLFYDASNGNIHIDSRLGTSADWYCEGSSFTRCTEGKWYSRRNGDWNSNADNDARVTECGDGNNNNNNGGGGNNNGGDCVQIRNLKSDFNGQWIQIDTKNGKPVYENQNNAKYKLFYANEGGSYYWSIGSDVNGYDWANGWCGRSDIKSCDGGWDDYDGSDRDSLFEDCGGFEAEQVPKCVKDNEYGSSLCVYMWNDGGYKPFEVSKEECVNDKPVYVHNGTDDVYYLHYNEYRKYVDSVNVSPEWIISKDVISTNGDAFCDDGDLLKCTQEKWAIYETKKDAIELVPDKSMMVLNRQCGAKDDAMRMDYTMFTVIICAAIVIIGLIVCQYRSKKKKQVIVSKGETVNECSEEEEEEEEIQIELNTTTQ